MSKVVVLLDFSPSGTYSSRTQFIARARYGIVSTISGQVRNG